MLTNSGCSALENPPLSVPTCPSTLKEDGPRITLSSLEGDIGTLSKPSKLPGYAWGISAKKCITGQKLRAACPESPCANCYALRGRYLFPNVQAAADKRLQAWSNDPDWVFKMAGLIARRTKNFDPYFRWFDSGDLQSVGMLRDIFAVAELLPHINFWLPTQERNIVNKTLRDTEDAPANLTIRFSLPKINGMRPRAEAHSSSVLPRLYKGFWEDRVKRSTSARHYCPASVQEGKCGDCRACWDRSVSNVVYLQH